MHHASSTIRRSLVGRLTVLHGRRLLGKIVDRRACLSVHVVHVGGCAFSCMERFWVYSRHGVVVSGSSDPLS